MFQGRPDVDRFMREMVFGIGAGLRGQPQPRAFPARAVRVQGLGGVTCGGLGDVDGLHAADEKWQVAFNEVFRLRVSKRSDGDLQ
jgi:hypothetical protein